MILPDGTPASPSKTDNSSLPSAGPGTSQQFEGSSRMPVPPPSYQQSSQYSQLPSQPIFVQLPKRDDSSRRACKRFTKAFMLAILIYALVSMLIGSMADSARLVGGGSWLIQDPSPPSFPDHKGWKTEDDCISNWNDNLYPALDSQGQSDSQSPIIGNEWPEVPDIPPIEFPDNAPYSSKTSLHLDAAAPSLLLVAAHTWGNVEFLPSNGDNKNITVDITAHFWRIDVRDRSRICRLRKSDGGQGVGIYVPRYRGTWRKETQVSFSIKVYFPGGSSSGAKSSPLYINSFETDLAIFSHYLGGLEGAVNFRKLLLRSANSRIHSESVFAKFIDIGTNNAQITGSYSSNDSLIIHTSNAKIDVTTTIGYSEKASRGKAYLDLQTTNAQLLSETHLKNVDGAVKGGSFEVIARTSNSRLSLAFPESPHTSFLKLTTKTSNARSDVTLNEAFEGSFSVATSSYIGTPQYHSRNLPDPSGEDRKRNLNLTNSSKGSVKGRVSWGSWGNKKHYGSVDIRTSNSQISLTL